MTVIRVGMADLNVAGVEESLRTTGLGSCVGIALYDSYTKIAGLAHIMLPTSTNANEPNRAKYANTAVPLLIELMEKKGANKRRLTAKLAGGAQMFTFRPERSDAHRSAQRRSCQRSASPTHNSGHRRGYGRELWSDHRAFFRRRFSVDSNR